MSSPGDFSPDTSSSRLNATIGIAAFVVIFGCIAFFVTLDVCLRLLLRRYTGIIPLGPGQQQQGTGTTHANLLNKGLDQGVINSLLPAFVYPDEKIKGVMAECAVCLSEFEDGVRARLLPKCNHAFHAECIDMWFQSHTTCPICRRPVVVEADQSPPLPAAIHDNLGDEPRSSSAPQDPIQVSMDRFDGSASAAPLVIVIPRPEDDPSASSSSPRASSFRIVIDVAGGKGEQQQEPKSPMMAATMERLRSLGRLLSRRDMITQDQQLPP